MNYGYAPVDEGDASFALNPDADENALGIQLYRRVAAAVDLTGKDVLDVGCGRGGGTAFVFRALGARSVTGVDFAPAAIAACATRYDGAGLRFVTGDAENLPFPESAFDAVINVESSHCYPSVERFLSEVQRVLRSGGYLLFADMRLRTDVSRLRELFRSAGFVPIEEQEITENIVRALDLDSEQRLEVIRRLVPKPFRRIAREFMATNGSDVHRQLRDGQLEYVRFVLQKP
jgi:SAM-dependent methyltransferase